MQSIDFQSQKVQKYLALFHDQNRLIKSSQSLIKHKKNPSGRQILAGNLPAILRAAKERFNSLNPELKRRFCELFCEFHKKLDSKVSPPIQELIAWCISTALGFIDALSGIMIGFLWMLRGLIKDKICKCDALNY